MPGTSPDRSAGRPSLDARSQLRLYKVLTGHSEQAFSATRPLQWLRRSAPQFSLPRLTRSEPSANIHAIDLRDTHLFPINIARECEACLLELHWLRSYEDKFLSD